MPIVQAHRTYYILRKSPFTLCKNFRRGFTYFWLAYVLAPTFIDDYLAGGERCHKTKRIGSKTTPRVLTCFNNIIVVEFQVRPWNISLGPCWLALTMLQSLSFKINTYYYFIAQTSVHYWYPYTVRAPP